MSVKLKKAPIIVSLFLLVILNSYVPFNLNYYHSLHELCGDYKVTFKGKVGGDYQSSNSIVKGTTSGIYSFTTSGIVELNPSNQGVISVPKGENIPGIRKEDIIYGAAVMQNPIRIFMGTVESKNTGDFGIHSMMKFGVPTGSTPLKFTGLQTGNGEFSYLPKFLSRADSYGGSVNLIYFVNKVDVNNGITTISGKLVDEHVSESAAANTFIVPIKSPIMGNFNDMFMFSYGATFKINISGNRISGSFSGTGTSVAQLVNQKAIFEVSFEGVKE